MASIVLPPISPPPPKRLLLLPLVRERSRKKGSSQRSVPRQAWSLRPFVSFDLPPFPPGASELLGAGGLAVLAAVPVLGGCVGVCLFFCLHWAAWGLGTVVRQTGHVGVHHAELCALMPQNSRCPNAGFPRWAARHKAALFHVHFHGNVATFFPPCLQARVLLLAGCHLFQTGTPWKLAPKSNAPLGTPRGLFYKLAFLPNCSDKCTCGREGRLLLKAKFSLRPRAHNGLLPETLQKRSGQREVHFSHVGWVFFVEDHPQVSRPAKGLCKKKHLKLSVMQNN